VEDHPDTRASMAKLLRREHLVQIADSAAQALSIASQQSFDLVISDLGLPDRSGLELMRELRELYNLKGICISGFGMEDDISNSKEAGFVQHLTKPISLDRLQSAIREVAELLEH
jgi:CheY-like chemotaxis protein